MPASPWGLVDEDLFDALFAHLERDEKVLAKARLVCRHWRQLVDAAVSEIEPRRRITEPAVSQLLRRFTGLTSINVGEPWRVRITDESVPALLVTPPPEPTVGRDLRLVSSPAPDHKQAATPLGCAIIELCRILASVQRRLTQPHCGLAGADEVAGVGRDPAPQ